MSKKEKSRIKCPGRFSELREYLHNDVLTVLREEGLIDAETSTVSEECLRYTWLLIAGEIYNFDLKDPYYESGVDVLRKKPLQGDLGHLSTIPLFPSTYHFEKGLIEKYLSSMGNNKGVIEKIMPMTQHASNFFHLLGREPSKIWIPLKGEDKKDKSVNLSGYTISADYGLGTAVHGGVKGLGTRSDSPFLLNTYKFDRLTHEKNLAGVVGFWAQGNEMIVSQMQSCKNAKFPEETCLGVASLCVAETAARLMGFDKIKTYSAKTHPIFHEHSDDKGLEKEFHCIWDSSSRFLGYTPSEGTHGYYFKDLKNNSHTHQ